METGLFTKRGAPISVHFGKIVTTNLWHDAWYEITSVELIAKLKACRLASDFESVRSAYPTIVPAYAKPYVRAPRPATSSYTTEETVAESSGESSGEQSTAEEPKIDINAFRTQAVHDMRQFFSEFAFEPAARFVNTLARQPNFKAAKTYVSGYAKLANNPDAAAIADKVKSAEFDMIWKALSKYPPEKQINERMDCLFGPPGAGKTVAAVTQYPDAPVITCNASILPDELLRTFDFNDENGNPVFKKSTLRECMEAGKPIIFDEINLLSFDCLRLLQTLTDSKEVFNYNGDDVHIQPGFKIVGTMNLTVNGQTYGLPEPLVDRCATITEYTLEDRELASYAY